MSEFFTPQNGEEPGDERPRLVLDTNTVLALWMFRDPALDTLRDWIEIGGCRLYSREDALEELHRVLAYRQFGIEPAAQRSIHSGYRKLLTLTSSRPISDELPACRDRDDQKFLEIALIAQASTLLTRDRALLRLARQRRIRMHFAIRRPEDFCLTCHEQAARALPQESS